MGELKAFPKKKFYKMKEILTVLGLGPFIANPSYKIPKKTKRKYYYNGAKREENQKVTKESQNFKGRMNSGTWKAISHQYEIFALWCKILCFSSFSASAPSFLLILICNVKFNSNSSCLDRLDKLGINSLQKLQI